MPAVAYTPTDGLCRLALLSLRRGALELGHDRIERCIHELQVLRDEVACLACKEEVERQIKLQKQSLGTIEHIWNH